MSTVPALRVRAMRPEDVDVVAEIFHLGWHDGHDGHVSAELARARTAASFRDRAAARVAQTLLMLRGSEVAGFVVVNDDELEQVYVAAAHRGRDVAPRLLLEGLRVVGEHGHERAWLAVAPGNARARRCYEKQGWVEGVLLDYQAEGPDGPISTPCLRYERAVAA
ncbi:MAG: GNAT family N-acetyltransferase [Nocardioides sp.]|nr:GNAT family N-acetyltransferase [Nocardioides sp.]